MIRFRPFRNSDPPALAEIWCSQPPQRGLMQPMTPAVFDHFVLSKPFFDRCGLIVAEEDSRPIGFAHAGFAALADGNGLDYEQGTTCLIMVAPRDDQDRIGLELLGQSEAYLRQRGARKLAGGSGALFASFYFGLYGGSCLNGVLASDQRQTRWFQQAGYEELVATRIYHCELAGFRPTVNRDVMRMRRECQLVRTGDKPPANWWEACTLGQIDRVHFDLVRRVGGGWDGTIGYWDVEPLASSWGVHAMGVTELHLADPQQTVPRGTFLLGESLKEIQSYGATLVEVQAGEEDPELNEICRRLGFHEIDRAVCYIHPAGADD